MLLFRSLKAPLLISLLAACSTSDAATTAGSTTTSGEPDATSMTTSPTTGSACTPGAIACSDAGAQACGVDGRLEPAIACPAVCVPDVGCVDCDAGATRCSAVGVERCDEAGAWQLLTACDADQGITCDADQGACVGACLPDNLLAAGSGFGPVGCEFYATSSVVLLSQDEVLGVFLTNPGDLPATVRVERPFWAGAVVEVAAGSTERLSVPWDNNLIAPGGKTVLSRGGAVRIRSDRPILVTQHAPATPHASNEASLLFPVHAWGTAFSVASFAGTKQPSGDFSEGSYVVVAAEDGTQVELVGAPGLQVHAGAGVDASGHGKVTLDRGDALQVLADRDNDITGSLVLADRPVQVIAAHHCALVPADVAFCDHLEESMPPHPALGRTHALIPPVQAGDPTLRRVQLVRVIALEGPTGVAFEPALFPAAVLSAPGEVLEVGPTDQPFVLQTTAPVLVAQYMVGASFDGSHTDPSLTITPPLESARTDHWFHTVPGWDATDVDIVAPAGTLVRLDGADLSDWTPLGASGLMFGHLRLPADAAMTTHTLVGDAAITASVYSVSAGTSSTSYWHPTGYAFGTGGDAGSGR